MPAEQQRQQFSQRAVWSSPAESSGASTSGGRCISSLTAPAHTPVHKHTCGRRRRRGHAIQQPVRGLHQGPARGGARRIGRVPPPDAVQRRVLAAGLPGLRGALRGGERQVPAASGRRTGARLGTVGRVWEETAEALGLRRSNPAPLANSSHHAHLRKASTAVDARWMPSTGSRRAPSLSRSSRGATTPLANSGSTSASTAGRLAAQQGAARLGDACGGRRAHPAQGAATAARHTRVRKEGIGIGYQASRCAHPQTSCARSLRWSAAAPRPAPRRRAAPRRPPPARARAAAARPRTSAARWLRGTRPQACERAEHKTAAAS